MSAAPPVRASALPRALAASTPPPRTVRPAFAHERAPSVARHASRWRKTTTSACAAVHSRLPPDTRAQSLSPPPRPRVAPPRSSGLPFRASTKPGGTPTGGPPLRRALTPPRLRSALLPSPSAAMTTCSRWSSSATPAWASRTFFPVSRGTSFASSPSPPSASSSRRDRSRCARRRLPKKKTRKPRRFRPRRRTRRTRTPRIPRVRPEAASGRLRRRTRATPALAFFFS